MLIVKEGKFSKVTLVMQGVSVIRYGKKIKLGILTTFVGFKSVTLRF